MKIMTTVTAADRKSAIGPANKMPSMPINNGRINSGGRKNKICRVSERNAPLTALPIAVKKVVEIGCKKSMNVKNRNFRIF